MAGVDVAALFASAKTNPSADVSALLASAKGEPSGNKASAADTEQLEKELMRLVKSGEYEQLQRTIDEAKPIVNLDCVVGFDGNTPLHWAVEKGHLQCARVLCERGAKVDSRERWQSWTPLMLAASKDRCKEAELLLAHGADGSLRTKGASAIELAASPEMLAILQPKSSGGGGSGAAQRQQQATRVLRPRGVDKRALRSRG